MRISSGISHSLSVWLASMARSGDNSLSSYDASRDSVARVDFPPRVFALEIALMQVRSGDIAHLTETARCQKSLDLPRFDPLGHNHAGYDVRRAENGNMDAALHLLHDRGIVWVAMTMKSAPAASNR